MTDASRIDCAALLAHADWVRALARQLVRDAHAAEDLAQDTLAAALVRPPPLDRPLRGWLAAVLRNLVREERRDSSHRGARERAAARAEADSSSEELLLRLDSHRALVEAVARLDEPYRAAILMRWFEGLAPAAIAARTGTPLRTVETRLHRALARLRADLDRTHGGDRRAWLLALIPYARGSSGSSVAALGALVMDAKLKIGVAVLAVVGVCSTLVLWRSEAAAPRAVAAESPAVEPEQPRDARETLAEVPAVAERRAPETPAQSSRPEPVPAPAPRLTGRVIDVERAPVAGVAVRYSDPAHGPLDGSETRTDAAGVFELERPDGEGHVDVVTPGWTCIFRPELAGAPGAPGASELVLVVARSITLGGEVVDEQGRALSNARVAVPLPFGLRARFDAILYGSRTIERATTSDAAGRFELAGVPVIPGVKLVTDLATYRSDERELPAYDELALRIVLRSIDGGATRLIGEVVDPAGEAVEGAWVALGQATARSGAGGTFALELGQAGELAGRALRAVKPGYLPAELARRPGEAWPEPLVLALGDAPLVIEGRVLDARGEPVPGAEVWSDGETHFGYIEIEGGEMAMRAGANIEAILRGDPWTWRTRTDAAGRFELRGLLPRDYHVIAFDARSLLASEEVVPAGRRNAELRLPDEELHPLVAGHVSNLSGEPLTGVQVVLSRLSLGDGGPANLLESRTVRTDAAGRFAFENVSRAVNSVRVQGADFGLLGFEQALAPDDDVEHLELAVPMRVHLQIDGGEGADYDEASVLGADGATLSLSVHHGQSSYAMEKIRLEQGRSEAFSVSELAATLVLYARGEELRRLPVRLVRGELNTIRP